MAYADTKNKQTIRGVYDLELIKSWHKRIGRNLTYFGLPGPEIEDLITWRDFLDRRRTGVESDTRHKGGDTEAQETIGRLNMNVMANGTAISSGFELLIADIEDVILDGVDRYGKQPCMSNRGSAQSSRFSYDLVNLDFNSGLGYLRGKSLERQYARRIDAIKELFRRQQGQDFLFLLTIGVRHTLGTEFDDYLVNLRDKRDRGSGWQDLISWYLARTAGQVDYKLKATVPSFVKAIAEPQMFRSTCLPPISYVGHENARMMHFVFLMEGQAGTLTAVSAQDDRELIELPMLHCKDGNLSIATLQHAGFEIDKCRDHLSFLPISLMDQLLEPVSTIGRR